MEIFQKVFSKLKKRCRKWRNKNLYFPMAENFTNLHTRPCQIAKVVKGSVSRQVRHRLLYIIRKLFLKPMSADHFYLFLLKGNATIYV